VSRLAAPDRARLLVRREHPVARIAGLAGLIVLWELLTRTGWIPPLFLPSPLAVLAAGLEMLRSGELVIHVITSLQRIALGFGLGLWLGIGEASKVAVITLGVFFPMAINTYTGVRHADPLLIRAAVSFGAGRWSLIRKVMLPSALPMVFAGLKLGAGTSLLLLVAAEMIAASSGIGFLVLNAQNLMETTKLMVGIVLLSLLGLASHWLLTRLERVAIPWRADA